MGSRWVARVGALVALLTPLVATSGWCGSVGPAMRQADPRLEKPVTLAAPRIYVGELLERLTQQTGVTVAANDRDGAADEQIAAFLGNVPLADAMDALWSLLSNQEAEWLWERSKRGEQFRYRLERPLAAQQLATRLSQRIQTSLEDEARVVLAALKFTAEQLEEAAKHDARVAYLLQSPRGRAGLGVFAETLSSEKQLAVLRGQERVRVPVSQLSPQGRAFVHSGWAASHTMRSVDDGPLEPVPEPTWIEFAVRRLPGTVGPSLFIYMEGMGGYGYMGGDPLDRVWRRRVAELWPLPGDTGGGPASTRPMTGGFWKAELPGMTIRGMLALRSRRLVEVVPVLQVRRPADRRGEPGAAESAAIRALLGELRDQLSIEFRRERPRLQSKWRAGILLLRSPDWFNEEAEGGTVPWAVVKKLRQSEDAGGGALSLRDLCAAAELLTVPQLLRLGGEEFPVMAHVARWRDLLLLMRRSPLLATRLLSPGGAPAAAVLPALGALPGVAALVERGEAVAVRVVQKRVSPPASTSGKAGGKAARRSPFTRSVVIEVRGAGGRVLTAGGFSYGGRGAD